MKDIKNEKFEIDSYFNFTIMDEFANRWNGDFEPTEVSIGISSGDRDCSIAEVKLKDFDSIENWQIIQTADNCNETEVLDFIKEKHNELKELLSYKLKNSDYNGEC